MADILTFEDIINQYRGNLVSYKDRPVLVISADNEGKAVKCKVFDLELQKNVYHDFNMKDFAPPRFRLGMMNTDTDCVYLGRVPMRKMQVGITRATLSIQPLPYAYAAGEYTAQAAAQSLNSIGLYNCIKNIYPSLEEAIGVVKQYNGACAFDKQFAVGVRGNIFYKTHLVGCIPAGKSKVSDIQFRNEWKYLSILLENNHEKTIAIACA